MIDAAENPRDKALIALLYDSGARPSEILNLRIKDVKLNKTHGEIFVNGKTGMRRIPIVFSIPYLTKWLNVHPRKNDLEAKLFPKLKLGRGGENLTPDGLDGLVKRLARKAGIKKRVTSYLFRHSRLTELANILKDSQLKALAGWTASSRMAEHYIRLAGLDIDSPILDYYGVKREKKAEAELKPRICPRCEHVNPPNAVYCEKCGLALDEKVVMEKLSREEELEKRIEELEKRYASDELFRLLSLENKILKIMFFKRDQLNAEQKKALERELMRIRAEIKRLKEKVSEEEFEKLQEMADVLV